MAFVIFKYMHIFYSDCRIHPILEKCAYLLYYIIVTVIHCTTKIPFVVLLTNLIVLFLLTQLYIGSIKKAIFAVLTIYFSLTCIETLFVLLTTYGIPQPLSPVHYESEFGMAMIAMICYAFVRLIRGFKNVRCNIPLPKVYWLSLFIIPCATICMLYPLFIISSISYFLVLIALISAFAVNLFTFYLYDKISALMQEQMRQRLEQEQHRFYENQVEIMVDALEKIKQIRHDLKNKLSPLLDLAQTGNIEALTKQIVSLMELCPNTQKYVQSGNLAIDSILNYKLHEAQQQNIAVTTKICIPKDLPLPTFDIAIILGNLLDNAKEATQNIKHGWIDCYLKYDKGRLLIEISNSYDGKLEKQGEKFLSRKANKENHGYGLKSITSTLQKYDGELQIWYDATRFVAKVLLYVPTENHSLQDDCNSLHHTATENIL